MASSAVAGIEEADQQHGWQFSKDVHIEGVDVIAEQIQDRCENSAQTSERAGQTDPSCAHEGVQEKVRQQCSLAIGLLTLVHGQAPCLRA